jgi:Zn-dependent M28 family amino/carboxypeptidase
MQNSSTPYELIELGGGSDYNQFMEAGIPVGGMSSGTDGALPVIIILICNRYQRYGWESKVWRICQYSL